MVLIDFTQKPPRTFAFGAHGACHEFGSARLTKTGVNVQLKANTWFRYSNGKFKLPSSFEARDAYDGGMVFPPESTSDKEPYATELFFK